MCDVKYNLFLFGIKYILLKLYNMYLPTHICKKSLPIYILKLIAILYNFVSIWQKK